MLSGAIARDIPASGATPVAHAAPKGDAGTHGEQFTHRPSPLDKLILLFSVVVYVLSKKGFLTCMVPLPSSFHNKGKSI